MSILDRKFPFVISHIRWRRKPKKKVVRTFVGYVPGLLRLAINVNRAVLDFVEEAFYEEEVIVEEKGLGTTRHFAFDVGFAQTPDGEQTPVLKAVEVLKPPACVHNYVVSKEVKDVDDPVDIEPEPDRRSFIPEQQRMRPDEDLPTMLEQVSIDLGPSQQEEDFVPGEVEGVSIFVPPSDMNGSVEG